MKKILVIILSIVLCMGIVSCNDSSESTDTKTVKVGLICLHGDNSTYDKNFIEAMKTACKNKGVEVKIVTDVGETNDCYDKAAELVDEGCNVIFADSFGHEEFLLKAAKEFTDVEFCHATGVKAHTVNQANYHNAFAAIYEGRYLAGIAAGLKLKEMETAGKITANNKDDKGNIIIGYIGAKPYAEVISGYTSFYLGVKSVVSNLVMKVTYTNSWYDEAAEKSAAEKLIAQGAALISQHADSMGAPTACETAGVPNVSYNGSTATACPNTYIVSSRINWIPYFEYMIDCVKEDKAIVADWTGTIDNGAVALTELGTAATAGTQAKIDEAKLAMKDGTLKVFDIAKFTVTVGEKVNTNATVDENGHLTKYLADVDGDFVGEKDVIKDGAFVESYYRSAPYFDMIIDGIILL